MFDQKRLCGLGSLAQMNLYNSFNPAPIIDQSRNCEFSVVLSVMIVNDTTEIQLLIMHLEIEACHFMYGDLDPVDQRPRNVIRANDNEGVKGQACHEF